MCIIKKLINSMQGKQTGVYEDGIKPFVQESGKTLALIPRAINAALAPVQIWIERKEYNVAETKRLLELKLEMVKPEDIVSPEAHVAVPAIQAISYCMDSEELRNMYANLIATSMIKDEKKLAHPSFVEIIKQLSPDEAKLLQRIAKEGNSFPLIDVQATREDGSYLTLVHNFTTLAEGTCDCPKNVLAYIDNLVRLRIIDIPAGVRISSDKVYEPLENSDDIQKILEKPLSDNERWEVIKKKFEVTNYGKQFINVCVKDISARTNQLTES